MCDSFVQRRLELLDLPNEIISHILALAFGDSVPCSLLEIDDLPAQPKIDPEANTPIKRASIVNHRLRTLILPLLFRHVHVTPNTVNTIVTFINSHNLGPHVTTAQVYLPAPSNHQHPSWWSILLPQFSRLSTLTITAPPNCFAEVVGQPIKLTDQWAYKIPYQTVQFKYAPSNSIPLPTNPTSILDARPWTSFHVNESSSLLVYTTYEYFHRSKPSPMVRADPDSPIAHFFHNLKSFNFTAIFPTYSHVAGITNRIPKDMLHLEHLTIKLLPDPTSTILTDTLEASDVHFDVNDPWNEYETSLTMIASMAMGMSATGVGYKLRELRVLDVQMEGIRDTIVKIVTGMLRERPELGWAYDEDGLWRIKRACEPREERKGGEVGVVG